MDRFLFAVAINALVLVFLELSISVTFCPKAATPTHPHG